jgi:ATP-binding cassette subfamily C protein LapB
VTAKLHGLPASASAVTAGLPLPEGRLTPSLFERAARRVGLAARVIEKPLEAIGALLTPAVLLLEDDTACVLLEPLEDGAARLVLPDNPDAETSLSGTRLKAAYTGFAILASPLHRYDSRTPDLGTADRRGHWFWGTVARSWRTYRDVILASFAVNGFALAGPLFIMNVYDRVVPNQAFETLWVLASGAAVIFLFDFVLRTMRGHFVDLAGRRADLLLSSQIYEHVLGMRLEARPHSVGAFASSLREFDGIRDFFTSLTLTTLVDLPFALLFLLVIWLVAGPLVIVPIAVIPVLLIYGLFVQPRLRRATENSQRAAAQKNATLVEGMVEAETVKALGIEGRLQDQLERATAEGARWGSSARHWALSVSNLANFLQQMVSVGIVVVGVYLLSDGLLSMGGMIAAVILGSRAVAPMAQFAGLLTRLSQAAGALRGLDEVMRQPVDRPDGTVFVTRARLKGEIEFDAVSFRYPGQELSALRDMTLHVRPGERVGIIGRVGSGKTTVNRLIAGLYHASEGAVRIDGVDVRQMDPGDLRHNMAYVSQDPQLLYGSLRDNLTLGISNADDQRIVDAVQRVGLADFVNRHPLGFDMPVGEHGAMLSGGQRHAVALARALVLDPPVMLLDEPTGSMDNRTEEHIKRRLVEVLADKTLVLVTHRAALLDLVERVIVVDAGRIVADGPKGQVLEALRAGRVSHGR